MAQDLQTPFAAPTCPTPSGADSGGMRSAGGIDLGPDSKPETVNSSGLPPLPVLYNPGEGDPGPTQVAMPPVASPGTFPSSGFGN